MSELSGVRSEGIPKVGSMMLATIMESSDLAPTCAMPIGWEENPTKEQWQLPVLQASERVAPTPASRDLTPKLVNLPFPHMSLALFKLVPLH